MTSFYSEKELEALGISKIGKNVLISRKASIYGGANIQIGDHVRIDDFCILSGRIVLGNYVHIAAYTGLFGGTSGIYCEDYVGISSRSVVYAESDDYSGNSMTNPMIPDEFRGIYGGKVLLKKHAIVGSGSTVLPGVTVGEGSAVGTMSLVNKDIKSWTINIGIPCKEIKERSKELLQKEAEFLKKISN